MLKKKKSDLETRNRIYYFIYKHPGLHLREIFRKLDLSEGTIRYHITYLTKSNLVTKKIEDRYTRFYPVADNIEDADKTIIHSFRKEATRNIIFYLLVCGYGTQQELSKNIKKSPSTVSFHTKKLLKKGIIKEANPKNDALDLNENILNIEEYEPSGREKVYYLDNPNMIYNFLTEYKEKLFDDETKKDILNQIDNYIDYKKSARLEKIQSSVNNYYDLVKEVFSSVINN